MRRRNIWIVGFLVAGLLLFSVMHFYVIPQRQDARQRYAAAQLEPATHDLSAVLRYKNRYMGNASNDINLFYNLPMSDAGMRFQLHSDTLTLEVDYQTAVLRIGEERMRRCLVYNSAAAFALIGNLKEIDYVFPDGSFRASRADVSEVFPDFADILQNGRWKTEVQARMSDETYVDKIFRQIFR